jgi:ribosomal protein S21
VFIYSTRKTSVASECLQALMLQPRNFQRLAQARVLPIACRTSQFSSYARLLAPEKPASQPTVFIPQESPVRRRTFQESPTNHPSSSDPIVQPLDGTPSKNISIDNFGSYGTKVLPRTGKVSGRSVGCAPGKFGVALTALSRILSENRVRQDFMSHKCRSTPGEERRRLKSTRHRRRFARGVAYTAGLVMLLRNRRY